MVFFSSEAYIYTNVVSGHNTLSTVESLKKDLSTQMAQGPENYHPLMYFTYRGKHL